MSERNSSPITPTAIKVSTGALEYLPVAKVSSMSSALNFLKDNGFWVIGTDADAKDPYTAKIWDRPVAIVIGSEGSGMRPSVTKQCDILVHIPLMGKISSLNASVSSGVVLFEALRQRLELQNKK
jgi:23S rRNA (guanosine2251-2'-O)-methyltransferase